MQRFASVFAAAVLATSSGAVLRAQQHEHTGGEQLGTVHFATSCSPRVATDFNRAVALLHSFEFGASIRAFSQVLNADSLCAMAHWGIALSRWSNPMAPGNRAGTLLAQGRQSADAATRLGAGATERERGYIRAVAELYSDYEHTNQAARVAAYARAMGDVVRLAPSDTEAKIFHAIALTAAASPNDKSYANQLQAGAILESLWVKQPDHPGLAHYIIHSYDYPPLADKARAAARRYAAIAPSAAHALHMPSHIFTRVGMWEESVDANHRSKEVALRDGSIGEALHASDYQMYAYLQMGRTVEAKAILDSLPTVVARFDPTVITGAAPPSAAVFAIAAIPARWALERRAWSEAAALEPKASAFPHTEAMTYFARSLGASRTGDLAKARSSIDSLASIEQRLRSAAEPYWAEQVAIQRLGAQAWLDLAEQHVSAAMAHMREAVAREDATEKSAVTPGPLAPAHELFGDMLLELDRPTAAREEYRATLEREPNRRHAREALQQLARGHSDR